MSVRVAFVVRTPSMRMMSRGNMSLDRCRSGADRMLWLGPTVTSGRDGGRSTRRRRCAALRCDATPPVPRHAAASSMCGPVGAPPTRNTP
jgi:hypothetical protein